jgi:diadenosine tetraphosphatase ApaH/serine/threonine PP2A family protein phosphatase
MPARNDVMTFIDGERYFINPGSVGQPRDGDPRAAYALVDTELHELTFGRVNYDIGLTQRQMLEHNLPINLIRRLQFGR